MGREKLSGMQEIAARAGVSVMTVSRALSGKGRIAESTRQRIAAIAAGMNFRPNLLARELKQGSACCVGMLWSLSHPYTGVELLRSLSKKLLKAGYSSMIVDSMSDLYLTRQALELLLARRVNVLLLDDRMGLERDEALGNLLRQFKSVILVKREPFSEAPFDQISIDIFPALEAAVRFCREQGRKHAAVLAPRPRHIPAWHRLSEKYALPIDLIEVDGVWQENLCAEVDHLKKRWPGKLPFDLIFSKVDESAAVLINYLRGKGIRVPEDVAVCGFNDSVCARIFPTPIASFETHPANLDSIVEELLFSRIRDRELPFQRITVPLRFFPRASAGTAEECGTVFNPSQSKEKTL